MATPIQDVKYDVINFSHINLEKYVRIMGSCVNRLRDCTRLYEAERLHPDEIKSNHPSYNEKQYREKQEQAQAVHNWMVGFIEFKQNHISFDDFNSLHSHLSDTRYILEHSIDHETYLTLLHEDYAAQLLEHEQVLKTWYDRIIKELIEPAISEHHKIRKALQEEVRLGLR